MKPQLDGLRAWQLRRGRVEHPAAYGSSDQEKSPTSPHFLMSKTYICLPAAKADRPNPLSSWSQGIILGFILGFSDEPKSNHLLLSPMASLVEPASLECDRLPIVFEMHIHSHSHEPYA